MSLELRRTIPVIITFILGVLMVGDFYLAVPAYRSFSTEIQTWALIMLATAYTMGAATLTINHGRNIIKRGKNWIYSVQLIIVLWGIMALGLGQPLGVDAPAYGWVWQHLYTACYMTIRGLAAFWTIGATYRAFKLRSVEAAILLGSGVILLLGNAAIGAVIWSGFPPLSQWILSVINAAATRAIRIGAAVGIIATGVRILVGYERGYLGLAAGAGAD